MSESAPSADELVAELYRIEEAIRWERTSQGGWTWRTKWPPSDALERLRELKFKVERYGVRP